MVVGVLDGATVAGTVDVGAGAGTVEGGTEDGTVGGTEDGATVAGTTEPGAFRTAGAVVGAAVVVPPADGAGVEGAPADGTPAVVPGSRRSTTPTVGDGAKAPGSPAPIGPLTSSANATVRSANPSADDSVPEQAATMLVAPSATNAAHPTSVSRRPIVVV